LVNDILASSAAKKLNEKEYKQLLQLVLIVLLQEQHNECAVQLALEPPNGVSPTESAIWLCHSYVAVPQTKESAPLRKQGMEKLLSAQSDNAAVLQAIGDCLFMAADYEKAADTYQRILQQMPNESMVRNNLALALVELEKASEARQVLSAAIQVKPDD